MTTASTDHEQVQAELEDAAAELASAERAHGDRYEGRVEVARSALRWAHDRYGDDLTIASSMGDVALVHLAGTTLSGADVFFLDTGYHFAETLATRDAYAAMLPLRIRTIYPLLGVAEQDARHGPRLHDREPDRCCAIRKVEPLARALEGYEAWASGVRRQDAPTRAGTKILEWDHTRSMVKLNPIAGWTDDDVDRYLAEHDVPQNPLQHSGYTSIGCAPCTRPTLEGEDPRAGRWSGSAKTECGIHT